MTSDQWLCPACPAGTWRYLQFRLTESAWSMPFPCSASTSACSACGNRRRTTASCASLRLQPPCPYAGSLHHYRQRRRFHNITYPPSVPFAQSVRRRRSLREVRLGSSRALPASRFAPSAPELSGRSRWSSRDTDQAGESGGCVPYSGQPSPGRVQTFWFRIVPRSSGTQEGQAVRPSRRARAQTLRLADPRLLVVRSQQLRDPHR